VTGPATGRAYRGQLPEARRADRRRRLLDAALELYGTVGYANTTIAQLCRESGVAPIKFYEEFGTKEALLLSLCEETFGRTMAALVEAVDAAPLDVEARSRAGIAVLCHDLLGDPRRARVLCIEMTGVSPTLDRRRREVLDGVGAFLFMQMDMLGQAAGRPLYPDPLRRRIVVRSAIGGINETLIGWLLDDEPPPIDRLVDVLTEMFVLATRVS
jgi:AcrR family transcriptional regulator